MPVGKATSKVFPIYQFEFISHPLDVSQTMFVGQRVVVAAHAEPHNKEAAITKELKFFIKPQYLNKIIK